MPIAGAPRTASVRMQSATCSGDSQRIQLLGPGSAPLVEHEQRAVLEAKRLDHARHPHSTCSAGGLRNTSPRAAAVRSGSRRRPGSQPSSRPTAVRASKRARCMPMQTCGPCAKAIWWRAFSRRTSKRSGSGNSAGSRFAPGDRDRHEVAAADRRIAEPHVAGRVAVDHRRRRLQPERLLDGAADQARVAFDERPLIGVIEQVQHRVRDHALGRLDAAEHQHRDVRDHLVAAEAAGLGSRRPPRATTRGRGRAPARCSSASAANASVPAGVTGCPAATPVTESTIASYQPRTRVRVRVPEAEGARDDGGRQRPRELAAQLRAPVRLDRVDQPLGRRLDDSREALAHRVEPERPRERVAVTAVLGAVEREHARPDDLAGREPGIVDREGRRSRASPCSARSRRVTSQAAQRGEPRDRLALAQPREQRMRVGSSSSRVAAAPIGNEVSRTPAF